MKAYERYQVRHKPAEEDESTTTIVLAMAANIVVAVGKTIASVVTGSASMLAEAVHSWVDVGNEFFIVRAFKTANRKPDLLHPMGYGRESYVWSLFAALGLLMLGSVATVWHGVTELRDDTEGTANYLVGYLVLGASFIVEGVSFVQTYRQMSAGGEALGRSTFEHAARTSNSPLRAVFTEDFLALISLVIAAVAMVLHQLTNRAVFDATGSIVIGVLMGLAALMLINNNREYLSGKSPAPEFRRRVIEALQKQEDVARVTFVYAEFIGPDRLLVIAGVALKNERTQAELAYALRKIESNLKEHKFIGMAFLSLATPDEDDVKLDLLAP